MPAAKKTTSKKPTATGGRNTKPKEALIKLPKEPTYWKNPLHLHEGSDPVTGLVKQEHIDVINARYKEMGMTSDDELMNINPGRGWTLDFDPIAKRDAEAKAKMKKQLGLIAE